MKHFLEQREKRNIGIDNNKIKKTYTMNVSLPPLENHSCPLSAFPTFRIRCMEGCWLRLQDLCSSPPRPMFFARKTIGFRPQDLWFWRATVPSDGGKSGWGRACVVGCINSD